MNSDKEKTDAEKFVDAVQRADDETAKTLLEAMLKRKCADKIRRTLCQK